MSSHINKLMNTITNKSAIIIGRENLASMSNSINKMISKSKYRDFMKSGNIIQLISRNSHRSLQICSSLNDPNRLVLNGSGQVGNEFLNSHFVIETESKHNHLKFKNRLTYIAFDNDYPCLLSEPTQKPKHKSEYIRSRNEFRLHEVIGSDEYFSLESVYFPGKYISVLPSGDLTVSKNKADESTHFYVHVINVNPANTPATLTTGVRGSQSQVQIQTQTVLLPSATPAVDNSSGLSNSQQKEQEANAAAQASATPSASAPSTSASAFNQPDPDLSENMPPSYTSLYPKLPTLQ